METITEVVGAGASPCRGDSEGEAPVRCRVQLGLGARDRLAVRAVEVAAVGEKDGHAMQWRLGRDSVRRVDEWTEVGESLELLLIEQQVGDRTARRVGHVRQRATSVVVGANDA